jgi:hypothetical protein
MVLRLLWDVIWSRTSSDIGQSTLAGKLWWCLTILDEALFLSEIRRSLNSVWTVMVFNNFSWAISNLILNIEQVFILLGLRLLLVWVLVLTFLDSLLPLRWALPRARPIDLETITLSALLLSQLLNNQPLILIASKLVARCHQASSVLDRHSLLVRIQSQQVLTQCGWADWRRVVDRFCTDCLIHLFLWDVPVWEWWPCAALLKEFTLVICYFY